MMRLMVGSVIENSEPLRWHYGQIVYVLAERDYPFLHPFLLKISQTIGKPIGFHSYTRFRGDNLATLHDGIMQAKIASCGIAVVKLSRVMNKLLSICEHSLQDGTEVISIGSRYRQHPLF